MDIVVVGAGSLGSLVGGLLAREHDVTLVGREPHVGSVSENGLSVVGAEQFRVHPNAQTTIPQRADLALVTVKAYDTAATAADLADCTLDACLSLQNGMGNESELAAELDCPVLAGTCSYGARLRELGTVAFTGRGEVVLGNRNGGRFAVADDVGAAFRAAGIETTVAADMPTRLWEKLAVNAGINAVTALARVPNGALADSPADAIATEAARETAAAARKQGIDLPDERAVSLVERVARDTAANRSSMHQDISAGRQTEIDAINGYVAETATVPVPVNETLAGLVRTWERHREQ